MARNLGGTPLPAPRGTNEHPSLLLPPIPLPPLLQSTLDMIKSEKLGIFSLNTWVVHHFRHLVAQVNALEPAMQALSDKQLRRKTREFKKRLKQGETLDDIQAEAFAVVREAAQRTLSMRHFDVQVVGGAVLHAGAIAEMKTGEGKTLVSTLAAYLNALVGKGVHVVTVNDYLARRDAEWMGRVHGFLGLSVGVIQEIGFDYLRDHLVQDPSERTLRWPDALHYSIVDEIDSVLIDEGRNPLLISNMSCPHALHYSIVDEIDSVLIDEGRNPLLISNMMPVVEAPKNLSYRVSRCPICAPFSPPAHVLLFHVAAGIADLTFVCSLGPHPPLSFPLFPPLTHFLRVQSSSYVMRFPVAAQVAEILRRDIDYTADLKLRTVQLTDSGVAIVAESLRSEDAAAEGDGEGEGVELGEGGNGNGADSDDIFESSNSFAQFVLTALKAKEFYLRDRDYIVKDGQVIIVDEFTGRTADMQRWSDGIHQAFTGRTADMRRWSDGIHQAVEAKEGVEIKPVSETVAQVTYQSLFRLYSKVSGMTGTAKTESLFRLYSKVSGMTGTAKTEEEEFKRIFGMPVVVIPTNRPNIRKDLDVVVFLQARNKVHHVIQEIVKMNQLGRPVLVGTSSVDESERLYAMLQVEHPRRFAHIQVLNARPENAAREAEIVAQAGRFGGITISTNMAGRGTDIVLGGNPESRGECCGDSIRIKCFSGKRALTRRLIDGSAGRAGGITISTNMAGRGTDIVLGGNPELLSKEVVKWALFEAPAATAGNYSAFKKGPHARQGFWPIKLQEDTLKELYAAQFSWRSVAADWSEAQQQAVLEQAETQALRPSATPGAGEGKEEGWEWGERREEAGAGMWGGDAAEDTGMSPLPWRTGEIDSTTSSSISNGSGISSRSGGFSSSSSSGEGEGDESDEDDAEVWGGGGGVLGVRAVPRSMQEMVVRVVGRALGRVSADCKAHCQEEGEYVRSLGGLHVIGTALSESRRIDNQVREGPLVCGSSGAAVKQEMEVLDLGSAAPLVVCTSAGGAEVDAGDGGESGGAGAGAVGVMAWRRLSGEGAALGRVSADCKADCQEEGEYVRSLGGLHVMGTALSESRRIDNQVARATLGQHSLSSDSSRSMSFTPSLYSARPHSPIPPRFARLNQYSMDYDMMREVLPDSSPSMLEQLLWPPLFAAPPLPHSRPPSSPSSPFSLPTSMEDDMMREVLPDSSRAMSFLYLSAIPFKSTPSITIFFSPFSLPTSMEDGMMREHGGRYDEGGAARLLSSHAGAAALATSLACRCSPAPPLPQAHNPLLPPLLRNLLSMEDDMMREVLPDSSRAMLEQLLYTGDFDEGFPHMALTLALLYTGDFDEGFPHMALTLALVQTQKTIEAAMFERRRQMLDYDQVFEPVASWPIDTLLKRLSRTTGIDISQYVDATSLSSALSHSPPPNAGHRWDLRKHLPHVLPPLPEVLPAFGVGSNSAAAGAGAGAGAAAAAAGAAAAGAGGAAGAAAVGSANKREEEEEGGEAEAMREELRWREILRDSPDLISFAPRSFLSSQRLFSTPPPIIFLFPPHSAPLFILRRGRSSKHLAALRKYLGDVVVTSYRAHLALFVASPQQMEFFERESLLSTLDRLWSVHIANMARLRNAVSVQGFGRENPLEEFKIEGTRFFISTLFAMRRESVQALLSAFLADTEGEIDGGGGNAMWRGTLMVVLAMSDSGHAHACFFISTLFAMRRESVQALLSAFLADTEGEIDGGGVNVV
ncbi:unnamed protein product [Closterium sp. NIES-64]|nr:unnamed protein product [Closterium sp. NIES-64]